MVKNFILASGSPQRKALLEQINFVPKMIVPADIDETPLKYEKPSAYVKRMAREKALRVSSLHKGEVILAVNTLLMQYFTFYSFFMDGLAFAGEALAGQCAGAKDDKKLKTVVRDLFILGEGLTLSIFTIIIHRCKARIVKNNYICYFESNVEFRRQLADL